MTTISALIPTAGRPSLARTLDSVRDQWQPGDEFVACCDRRAWTPDAAWREMVTSRLPAGVRYTEVRFAADHMCWGHEVLSLGLTKASGQYLTVNDDDDIYTPGAFDAIRNRAAEWPDRPLVFRFRTRFGAVVPPEPNKETVTPFGIFPALPPGEFRERFIGGHCLVTPNAPGRVGRYTCRYNGDFDYIVETLRAWEAVGRAPVLCPEVIAWARPSQEDWGRMFPNVRTEVAV